MIFVMRVMRAVTGQWKSLREIAGELGMNNQGNRSWSRGAEAKRVRRALSAIEAAGFPLQVEADNDDVDSDENCGKTLYYRLLEPKAPWRIDK